MAEPQIRYLTLQQAGESRVETYLEREWTVVPVIALVEGVIHASNAETPELVPYETFARGAVGWNGRPIFIGHPTSEGSPIGGNTPATLEALACGQVFGASLRNRKLQLEAWIDNARADIVPGCADMLARIANGDQDIEISVGVFIKVEDESGNFNGRDYAGVWSYLVQDHVALLPKGEIGACSRDMGCGVRAAKGAEMAEQQSKKSWIARAMAMFRGLQAPEDMSDNDIRRKIGEALRKLDPRAYYPEAIYADQGIFVYCVYVDGDCEYFQRTYALDAAGEVTIGTEMTEVEPILTYEAVGADAGVLATARAATGCKCGGQAPVVLNNAEEEKRTMKREDILKALEKADDKQLEAVSQALGEAPPAVTPAADPPRVAAAAVPAAEVPAVAAPPTFETLLAAAPAAVRETIEGSMRAAQEKKDATITVLKGSNRCTISDEELKAMSQAQLDALVKLSGVEIKAAVDFSGQGAPRPQEQSAAVPAAPDLVTALKAHAEKK